VSHTTGHWLEKCHVSTPINSEYESMVGQPFTTKVVQTQCTSCICLEPYKSRQNHRVCFLLDQRLGDTYVFCLGILCKELIVVNALLLLRTVLVDR